MEEKLNKGTTFLTIIVKRTKRNANVLDISLGLKSPKLKVHTYVSSKNTKKLTDISFLQAGLSADFQHKIMIILVEKTLIIFAHAVIIFIISKSL